MYHNRQTTQGHKKCRTSLSRVGCGWYWKEPNVNHVVFLLVLDVTIELCVSFVFLSAMVFSLACAILLLHLAFNTPIFFFPWPRTFLKKSGHTHGHGPWSMGRACLLDAPPTNGLKACHRKCACPFLPLLELWTRSRSHTDTLTHTQTRCI